MYMPEMNKSEEKESTTKNRNKMENNWHNSNTILKSNSQEIIKKETVRIKQDLLFE